VAVANVQRVGKGNNAASNSIVIGSGDGWSTPTAGNLLVVSSNGDFTSTAPTGSGTWTAGPSIVDGNGVYTWYKVATGTESAITVSLTSGTFDFVITACEYSGTSATPFDVSNSSTVSGSPGFASTSASVTTTAAADLIVAFGLFHSAGATAPTFSSWSNSFTNGLSASSGLVRNQACYTFVGELIVAGAAGAYSTVLTTATQQSTDRQCIVLAFKAAAGAAAGEIVIPRRPSRGLYMR
jgi:hypothetical protein